MSTANQYKRLLSYLKKCEELPDYDGIIKFHYDYEDFIKTAKGSKKKHQAWQGGYVDHLVECMMIGDMMYERFEWVRPLAFDFANVVKVLYFHDVEKIFKYGPYYLDDLDEFESATFEKKDWFYKEGLPERYNVVFTDEELNALTYIHGEKEYGDEKQMLPLGAFCHACDCLSARMWFDHPTKQELGN